MNRENIQQPSTIAEMNRGEHYRTLVADVAALFGVKGYVINPNWSKMDEETVKELISDIVEVGK